MGVNASGAVQAHGVACTRDGGFVVVGHSGHTQAGVVIKLDAAGKKLWEYRRAPDMKLDVPADTVRFDSAINLPDGSLALCGRAPVRTGKGLRFNPLITHLSSGGELLSEELIPAVDKVSLDSLPAHSACTPRSDGFLAFGSTHVRDAAEPTARGRYVGWYRAYGDDAKMRWERLNPAAPPLLEGVFATDPDDSLSFVRRTAGAGYSGLKAFLVQINGRGEQVLEREVPDYSMVIQPLQADGRVYVMSDREARPASIMALDPKLETVHERSGVAKTLRAVQAFMLPDGTIAQFGRAVIGFNVTGAHANVISADLGRNDMVGLTAFGSSWNVEAVAPCGEPGSFAVVRTAFKAIGYEEPIFHGPVVSIVQALPEVRQALTGKPH